MIITDKLLTPNAFSRPKTFMGQIKGVIVHYVANPGSSAVGNRNYFESLKDQTKTKTFASSHYIIGLEGEIIRCVPENEMAYHANNANSNYIGIECCHPDAGGKFNDKTYNSLIELTVDILRRYNASEIKRHYDITGKICPKYYVENQSAWKLFLDDVSRIMNSNFVDILHNGVMKRVSATNREGRWETTLNELANKFGHETVGIRTILELTGHKVLWINGVIEATKD